MLAYGERDHELVSMMEITKRKVKLKIKTPVVVIVNIYTCSGASDMLTKLIK